MRDWVTCVEACVSGILPLDDFLDLLIDLTESTKVTGWCRKRLEQPLLSIMINLSDRVQERAFTRSKFSKRKLVITKTNRLCNTEHHLKHRTNLRTSTLLAPNLTTTSPGSQETTTYLCLPARVPVRCVVSCE